MAWLGRLLAAFGRSLARALERAARESTPSAGQRRTGSAPRPDRPTPDEEAEDAATMFMTIDYMDGDLDGRIG